MIPGLLSEKQFRACIDFLTRKYRIISVHDYKTGSYPKSVPCAILTFDDGLLDHYERVFPVLVEIGISGAFFISGRPLAERKVPDQFLIQAVLACARENPKVYEACFEAYRQIVSKTSGEQSVESETSRLWTAFSKTSLPVSKNSWSRIECFFTELGRSGPPEYRDMMGHLFESVVLREVGCTEEEVCEKFFMNGDQIREMHSHGMEFGLHGYTHGYGCETLGSYEANLLGLKKCLGHNSSLSRERSVTDSSVFMASYPHGKITEGLESLGINLAFTTENRCLPDVYPEDCAGSLRLPRVNCLHVLTEMNLQGKKIVIMSTSEQGKHITIGLMNGGFKPSHFVTMSCEYAKKHEVCDHTAHKGWCADHDIHVYEFEHFSLKTAVDLAFFEAQKFDIMILAGWSHLIPKSILETLRIGAIGQHGSAEVLPRGRGRATTNWAILQGRKRLTWNIFFLTPKVDDGTIIDTRTYSITPWDTVETIYKKHAIAVKQMLLKNLPSILSHSSLSAAMDAYESQSQLVTPSYYVKRNPKDGLIDWSQSVYQIFNLVRAVSRPYPGAFTFNGLDRITIWKAQPFEDSFLYPNAKIGEVVEDFSTSFLVNCCDGTLLITDWEGRIPYLRDILK